MLIECPPISANKMPHHKDTILKGSHLLLQFLRNFIGIYEAKRQHNILPVVILIVFLLVFPTLGLQQNGYLVSSHGKVVSSYETLPRLRVSGKYIVNEYNQTVRLTGLGWMDLHWRETLYQQTIEERVAYMKQYGVPHVRIALNYSKYRDILSYRDYAYDIVKQLNDAGVYSYVGFWDADNAIRYTPEEWYSILEDAAERYGSITGFMGIQPANEPHFGDEVELYRERALIACQRIHAVNPDLIIFLMIHRKDNKPLFEIDPYIIDNPLPEPNIVYVVHHYYWIDSHYFAPGGLEDYWVSYNSSDFETGKVQLEDLMYQNFLRMDSAPVMVDEFGIGTNRGAPTGNSQEEWSVYEPNPLIFLQDYLDILKKHGTHWNYWVWWRTDNGGYGVCGNSWDTLSKQSEVIMTAFEPLKYKPS